MDVITKAQRSYVMSRIKGKNTKPEVAVFDELVKLGFQFEKHFAITGNPDIVFRDKKVAVFIDGEFWHGKYFTKRKLSLPGYWVNKITRNRKRDRRYRKQLREEGWTVLRLWDDDIKKNLAKEVRKIVRAVNKSSISSTEKLKNMVIK